MQNLDARRAKRLILAQAVLALLLFMIAAPFGTVLALSALIGGGAAALGSALFGFWVFGRYRANEPGRLVARFYAAELLKLAVVLAVFGVTFAWFAAVNLIALFAAFLIVQVVPPVLANRLLD